MARERWRKLIAAFEVSAEKLAALMQEAEDDVLTYMTLGTIDEVGKDQTVDVAPKSRPSNEIGSAQP